MRFSSVRIWKGLLPFGNVSSSTMLAVFGGEAVYRVLATPARRHRREKDQSFTRNAPSPFERHDQGTIIHLGRECARGMPPVSRIAPAAGNSGPRAPASSGRSHRDRDDTVRHGLS